MKTLTCDVAVVGAGLSGLSAAFYLKKRDREIGLVVLEAKDRVGGRTFTTQLKAAGGTLDAWDLGGEWVGRPQPHLHYLLKKFNMSTFNPVLLTSNQLRNPPTISWLTKLDLFQFLWKLRRLKKKFASVDLNSTVEALESDGITLNKYIDKHLWTEEAKRVVESASRCMFGLSPSEMTLLYFLMYVESAGGLDIFIQPSEYSGKESRVKGGLYQLSVHLLNKIGKKNVYLNQAVIHIVQTFNKVVIITNNRLQVSCKRVIIAIPPHLAAAINYTPEMPSTKRNLLKNVPLAYIIKFVFSYEEAFWREDDHQNGNYGFQTILTDPVVGFVGIVYDATSAQGKAALVGFISTAKGNVAKVDNKDYRRDAILELLQDILGSKVHTYIDSKQKDWSKEPYNGGCFLKSLIPGATRYFNQELRNPFDRVHFGGTETATVWCGFMNGAIQAGFRAATEVLYHLHPQLITSPDPEHEFLTTEDSNHQRIISGPLVIGFVSIGLAAVFMVIAYRSRSIFTFE